MICKTLLTLTLGALALTQAAQDDAAKKELAKVQREWKVISLEREGNEKNPRRCRTTVREERWYTTDGDDVDSAGRITKIDPTQNPRTIDIRFEEGPDDGKTLKGIYQLEGDEWKILLSAPGKDRPKALPKGPGTSYFYIVLKRDSR